MKFKAALALLVRCLDGAAVLSLMAMMLLTTSDVVLRKIVNKPLLGVTELVELALGLAIFMALPGVFARGSNIVVDVVDTWLPDFSKLLRRIAAAFSLMALATLSWHMWRPLLDIISYGDTSADLQIPKIWFMAPAWAGVVVATLVAAIVLVAGESEPDRKTQPS
ncbi:MAG: TRAP transporter small permease [Burkholderiales bacterium]